MPRTYTPQTLLPGTTLALEKAASAHVAKVLRLRVGDSVTVFNGDGFDYSAKIKNTGRQLELDVIDKTENTCESPLQITLAQSVCRGDRMDFVLQKSVELGVASIQLLLTEKTSVKLDTGRIEKKMRHWQAVVISACEQCGRSVVPELSTPRTLSNWLDSETDLSMHCALDPTAGQSLSTLPPARQNITLIVGPESGFSVGEIALLEKHRVRRARIGPRILRAETAALAGMTALQVLHGDFSG